MAKLTVKKIVGTYDKSKDGKPFLTKQGKPYSKSTVTFEETGEKLVTVMVWSGQTCNEGQVFDGEIAEREWQGKKYYDLKVVNEKEKLATELAQIKFSIANLHRKVGEIMGIINMKVDDGRNSDGSLPPNFDVVDDIEDANAELESLADDNLII